MKVVILDERKKRKQQIEDLCAEKGYDVVACSATGDFMEVIETTSPDTILMDVESWQHGKPMYTYFKFSKKLDDIPIFFFNAPENFSNINDRTQNQQDKVFHKHTEIDEVVGSL